MAGKPVSEMTALERHPLSVVHIATMLAARTLAADRSEADNKANQKKIDDVLRKAAKQAETENGYDFTLVDCLGGNTSDDVEKRMVELHSELAGIQDILEKQAAAKAAETEAEVNRMVQDAQAGLGIGRAHATKLSDEMFAEHSQDEISAALKGGAKSFNWTRSVASNVYGSDILATLFKGDTGSPGFPTFRTRDPGVTLQAAAPLYLMEVINTYGTDQNAILYLSEKTHTSGAASQAGEGAAVGDSTFEIEENTVKVETIGNSVPISEQLFEDSDEAIQYINLILPLTCYREFDKQLVAGTGASNQIRGFTNITGTSNEALQKMGNSDPRIKDGWDSIFKARTKVNYDPGFAMATHVVMNPLSWQEIVTSKADGGAGTYFAGDPRMDFGERAAGMPVVQNSWLEHGVSKKTGFVADFTPLFNSIRLRRDMTMAFGYNADDFKRHQMTAKATLRAALVCKRPASICMLTRSA